MDHPTQRPTKKSTFRGAFSLVRPNCFHLLGHGRKPRTKQKPGTRNGSRPCLVASAVSLDLFWTRAKIFGQSKNLERETAPGPCLVASAVNFHRKHPQKGGSDSEPSRGRLQPSRRAERALLRKRRSKGAGGWLLSCRRQKIKIPRRSRGFFLDGQSPLLLATRHVALVRSVTCMELVTCCP